MGLAAAIFSRDITNALSIANKLQAGTVWVNSHSIVEVNVPFGGFKRTSYVTFSEPWSSFLAHA